MSSQKQPAPESTPIDFKAVLSKELETLRQAKPGEQDPITMAHEADLSGIAFSGGGIRSATFNLGIIQALASLGILEKFDYLSTVSGGGYIGSWFAAWLRRQIEKKGPNQSEQGFQDVMDALAQSVGTLKTRMNTLTERSEPAPISHLREFSNYLTPRKGLWGTDTWTVAVAYLRNFLLTLSVLVGALVAVIFWVRGAVVLDALMLSSMSIPINKWVYWLFIAAMAITAFASAWDLRGCRASAANRQAPGDRSALASRVAVILTIIAIWLGAAVLWQQRYRFLARDNVFETISAFLIALGIVLGGGILGAFLAACKAKPGSDDGRSHTAPRKKESGRVWSKCKRCWAALGGAAIFFFAIAGLCHWFSGWSGKSGWLESDYWAAVMAGPPLMLAALTLFAMVFIGLAGRDLEELEREWLARMFAAITKWTVLFCLLTIAVIMAPPVLSWFHLKMNSILSALWAVISAAGAWLGHSGKEKDNGSAGLIRKAVMAIAPVVFMAGLLVILISILDEWLGPLQAETHLFFVCMLGGIGLFLITLAWSGRVGVNTFSLHALYGNRLIRAYLGASNLDRHQHPFTGFDLNDNKVRMADLVPDGKGYRGPYLLINAAINLVHATRLAWQQRKAGAFLFSPLYCGYEFPKDIEREDQPRENSGCYVPSRAYADGKHSEKGISLGKAMTISGAAACPNMGYRTSPALAFLMTVFNVRLGWWLPNTATPNHEIWRKPGPSAGLLFLARELLGLTDASRNYTYISDGGHFENLGIYELVRRRCRYIIACDAEEDARMTFGGLGIAIERCRTDFGIPIDIDVSQLRHDPETGLSRWHCAIGRIRYGQADAGQPDGILLYLKASLIGDEPRDIGTYAAANPAFPHQSTADQWFDEVQFESYRALGHHIANSVLAMPVQVVHRNQAALALGRQVSKEEVFLKELFVELVNQWYPNTDVRDRPIGDHDALLGALIETLRQDPLLAFLDWQIYPDLGGTVRAAGLNHRPVPWVPINYAELRAGFFFCRRLIQFMQQVYHERDLGTYYDAPSHRGWMNLFQRWSLSRMVRYTWTMTAGCYSKRFQTFCAHHLRLEISELFWSQIPLEVKKSDDGEYVPWPQTGSLPAPLVQSAVDAAWRRAEQDHGLDFFETQLAREYMRLYSIAREEEKQIAPKIFRIHPLQITTEDPAQIHRKAFASITVGFAIVRPDTGTLLYLRIRPAMRNMNLACKALEGMINSQPPMPSRVSEEAIAKMKATREHWHRRIYLELYPEQMEEASAVRRHLARMINQEIKKAAPLPVSPRLGKD